MKSWYPGNLEVTIEKTCQSYSSMMASMSRASCCRAAPNWKNVDFSSCNNRQTPETVSRFVWGTELIAEAEKKKKKKSWSEWVQIRLKKPDRIKTIFNFAISESEPESAGDKRECECQRNEGRERGNGKETKTERCWESEIQATTLRERDCWQQGGLMVGDNCLITHRFDSLQPSVANITTAVCCLES